MKDVKTLLLISKIATLLEEYIPETEVEPRKMIGTLAHSYGLTGFKNSEIGTPVFEFKDRYLIVLEALTGKASYEVTFYKSTLTPSINFI